MQISYAKIVSDKLARVINNNPINNPINLPITLF